MLADLLRFLIPIADRCDRAGVIAAPTWVGGGFTLLIDAADMPALLHAVEAGGPLYQDDTTMRVIAGTAPRVEWRRRRIEGPDVVVAVQGVAMRRSVAETRGEG